MAVFFAEEATGQKRILITEPIAHAGVDLLRHELPQTRIDERFGLSPAQLRALIGEYSVLIVRSETRVTDDLLAAAPHLKVIGRAGSGIDNIDLDATFRHRVLVVHAPRGNVVAVAEHTMALVLALARQLPAASASLKAGRWEKRQLVGVELAHKTLGILGLGRIGREVARLAQAFGMRVLASDPLVSAEQARSGGVTLPGKEEVLRQADVVTLHAAPAGHADAVRPLIGARELALLKPGAFLVNCARGGLIDEAALLDALERGRLAGVALDVFSQEPIGDDALLRRLLAHERVLPTPHLGASTSEAQARVAVEVARQVIAALHGDTLIGAPLPSSPLTRPA
jgi:D-3-phosphoglycerate dehydrogenase / 2-oxoglutarate reductase